MGRRLVRLMVVTAAGLWAAFAVGGTALFAYCEFFREPSGMRIKTPAELYGLGAVMTCVGVSFLIAVVRASDGASDRAADGID